MVLLFLRHIRSSSSMIGNESSTISCQPSGIFHFVCIQTPFFPPHIYFFPSLGNLTGSSNSTPTSASPEQHTNVNFNAAS